MEVGFTLVTYPNQVLAWADNWPGLVAGGATREAAEQAIPAAIAEYANWLGSAGMPRPTPAAAWRITSILDGTTAPGGDVCSPADRAPIAAGELEAHLAIASRAVDDLIDATRMPDDALDHLPEGMVPEHVDPWAPDVRTIRGILLHTLQMEVFYRGSLVDGPAVGIFEPVTTAEGEWRRTLAAIRNADASRVYRPERAGVADEWTVRKVLRRLISHHRQHTAEVRERTAR